MRHGLPRQSSEILNIIFINSGGVTVSFKKFKLTLVICILASLISGCSLLKGFKVRQPTTYKEPTVLSDVSRVRFIGNVTGTGVRPFGSEYYDGLVYHGVWGHYNSTKDIGMPKISYRKSDYEGYYYEVYVKSGRARFLIKTDATLMGTCMAMFEVKLEAGKDYEFNYDPHASRDSCILHANEIVKDEKMGAYTLKKIETKDVYGKGDW